MPPASVISHMHTCPLQTPGAPPIPHVGGPILPPCLPTVMVMSMPAAPAGNPVLCVGPPDTTAKGSMTVHIGGKPFMRQGDTCAHGGSIVMGFPTVMVGG